MVVLKLTLEEVDPVLEQLYISDTIKRSLIPLAENWRRVNISERNFRFFLNSQFDFSKKIWRSGLFNLKKKDWAMSDTDEYKFPILGGGSNQGLADTRDVSEFGQESDILTAFEDDRLMFHRQRTWSKEICKDKLAEKWCKSFGISFTSSNNPEFFKARKGYVICKNTLEYSQVPAYVSFQVNA